MRDIKNKIYLRLKKANDKMNNDMLVQQIGSLPDEYLLFISRCIDVGFDNTSLKIVLTEAIKL